jgi:uncharacterized protein YprB with RNaseH-like and TPR domain
MLSFDIETEGLNSSIHRITVASIFDPCRNIEITYNFLDTSSSGEEIEDRKREFLRHLDEAPALCCFNGVKFDIPFIVARFNVQDKMRVHRWISKLFDLFEVCRLAFDSSCSLQSILEVVYCVCVCVCGLPLNFFGAGQRLPAGEDCFWTAGCKVG